MSFWMVSTEFTETVTPKEKHYFLNIIRMLRAIDGLEFLKEIDSDSFDIYWHHAMNTDNGILGCYSILHPRTIFISTIAKGYLEGIVSTFFHELHHFYMRKKYGYLIYSIISLPIIRNYWLEPAAKKIENIVEENLKYIKIN